MGFISAGVLGAAAGSAGGAAAAIMLKRIGDEISKRYLSSREKVRIGGVIAIAAANIEERLRNGEKLRSDDFFQQKSSGRSSAEEVAENVLLTCQREAEERKVPYMGYLLSNLAFDSTISTPMAHFIIRTADSLTYRQLCLLKLAALRPQIKLRANDYRKQDRFDKSLYQVLYECLNLYNQGLINFGGTVAFGPTDVNPAVMTIQGLGADLFNLMSLAKIPVDDLRPVIEVLQ